MSEKVLGVLVKVVGVTCAKCYYVYCDELKCPNPDCGEINKEDIITFNRSELVPVRLRKESVDLKWLEKYCRIIPSKSLTQYEIGYKQAFKDLLYAVRAKAKKANK